MPDHPVIPYIFANGPGNTADADLINADLEYLRAWLDSRFGNATPGQLWVANGSAVATPRTLSGHGTLSSTGVLTITDVPDNVVGEEELTTALAQKLGVTEASTTRRGNHSVATDESIGSSSYTDLATVGPTITLNVPTNGLVLLFFKADLKCTGGAAVAYVDVQEDGTSLTSGAGMFSENGTVFATHFSSPGISLPGGASERGDGGFIVLQQTSAGDHTYKMVYKVTGGGLANFQNRRLYGVAMGF